MKHLTLTTALAAGLALGAAVAPLGAFADAADNVMRVGVNEEPVTLDPANGISGAEIQFLYTIYDRLLDYDRETLEPLPMLAENFYWEDDNLTLVLELRDGVTFHDGTPMDAEAVKTSFEYYRAQGRQSDLNPVTEFEIRDDHTIALHLDEPYAVLTSVLADRAGMIISPQAIETYGTEQLGSHPVGTGKFRLEEWRQGDRIILTAFDNYWNPDLPKLDGMEYVAIPNPTTQVSALMAGQVDYLLSVDPVNIPVLDRNPNVDYGIENNVSWSTIALNTSLEPVDDKLVRQAFAFAIDREALFRIGYGDAVEPQPANIPAPPDYWPSTEEYNAYYTYDPDRARELLAEAGYPDGVEINICANANSGSPVPGQRIIEAMTQQTAAAGIRLNAQLLPSGGACIELFNFQKTLATHVAGWSGRPNPYMTYQQIFGSDGPYHVSKEAFPGVDEALAELLATTDQAEQDAIFDRLNELWIEYQPMIPMYYQPRVYAFSADLAGHEANILSKPDLTGLYFEESE